SARERLAERQRPSAWAEPVPARPRWESASRLREPAAREPQGPGPLAAGQVSAVGARQRLPAELAWRRKPPAPAPLVRSFPSPWRQETQPSAAVLPVPWSFAASERSA